MKRITTAVILGLMLLLGPGMMLSSADAVPSSGWGRAEQIETDNMDFAEEPKVAFDLWGNAMAIWEQYDGLVFNIWSNYFINGSGWGTAELIEKDNSGSADDPQVAFDPSGNAVAVWVQWVTRPGKLNVWSNRYIPGSGWGSAEIIGSRNSSYDPWVKLAVDPSGNAMAVWIISDGSYLIYNNRYTPGSGWGRARSIVELTSGQIRNIHASSDKSGNAMVIYTFDDNDVHGVNSIRYTFGSGWGPIEKVDSSSKIADGPDIVFDQGGNAIAVWYQSDDTRNNIWSNRYTPGSGWGTAAMIETDNSGGAVNPDLGVDQLGNVAAVWFQFDGSKNNIWSNRYVPGVGWGEAQLIETNDSESAEHPNVAVDPSGSAVVVWTQNSGIVYNIMSNRFVPDKGWGEPELIETANYASGLYPKVAMDPWGNALVVWYQYDGKTFNIWSNRYIRPDTTPPTLTLTEPANESVLLSQVVRVSGMTEPGASVTVNGYLVYVDPDGSFSLSIPMKNEINVITVKATDEWGNSMAVQRTVHYSDPLRPILERISDLENSILKLQNAQNGTYARFGNIETLLEMLRNNVSASDTDIEMLKALVEGLEENLTSTGAEIENLMRLLESLQDDFDGIDSDVIGLWDNLDGIDNDVDSIRDDLDDLDSTTDEINESLMRWGSDLSEMKGEDEKEKDDIDELQGDLKTMTSVSLTAFVIVFVLILIMSLMVLMRRKVPSRQDQDDFE